MKILNYKNKNIKKNYLKTWINSVWERKKLSKPKTWNHSEQNIINTIRNIFIIKKEKKNKKEIKDRVIKDRIIRYISTKINSYKE